MGDILELMKIKKLSASNIAFGRGAGTLQLVNRDNYGFAMKASARRDGRGMWHDVWKEAPGKASKRGKITLVHNYVTNKYRTIRVTDEIDQDEHNVMDVIYMNGPLENMYTTFDNVRSEAMKSFRSTKNS